MEVTIPGFSWLLRLLITVGGQLRTGESLGQECFAGCGEDFLH